MQLLLSNSPLRPQIYLFSSMLSHDANATFTIICIVLMFVFSTFKWK